MAFLKRTYIVLQCMCMSQKAVIFVQLGAADAMKRRDEKWESQLKKGLLDYFVLLVLAQKPAHGYAIAASLRAFDAFDVGEGTLYPLLGRLSEKELVKSAWVTEGPGPARKVYTVTRKGRKEIATMDKSWRRVIEIRETLGGLNAQTPRRKSQ